MGRDTFLSNPRNVWPQQQGALLLSQTLTALRGHVGTVANIGARVDISSGGLAPLFPEVKFVSVDFQDNLASVNSILGRRDNWEFKSGYPLQLLEKGDVHADLVFFSSVTPLMTDSELNEYLDVFARSVVVVVFNEPWFPMTFFPGFFRRPEKIPNGKPYLGGPFYNYHHNYIAKLLARGFKITMSQIVENKPNRCFMLQIVATNEAHPSWKE